MPKNYRRISFGIGFAFIVLIVAFIIFRIMSDKDIIKVGYMQISAHAPLIAAKELNIFEKHGLRVQLVPYPDTPTLMDGVEKGQVDVGYQLTADIVLKSAASTGKNYYVYYVARSTIAAPIDGFYALKQLDSNSLKGKKIGCFPGPTGEAMTRAIMEKVYGLKAKDYTLDPIAGVLQITKLKSGSVTALFTYEPIGTLLVEKFGAIRVLDAPVEKYIVDGPWDGGIGVFTNDLVVRRRKTAINFQNAMYEIFSLIQGEKRGTVADAMVKLQPGLDLITAAKVPLTEAVIARTEEEAIHLEEALERQIAIYRSLGILPSEGRANLKIFRVNK